jgi:hypothetical protein
MNVDHFPLPFFFFEPFNAPLTCDLMLLPEFLGADAPEFSLN